MDASTQYQTTWILDAFMQNLCQDPYAFLHKQQVEGLSYFCLYITHICRHNPNFISNIISGDESWIYSYDP